MTGESSASTTSASSVVWSAASMSPQSPSYVSAPQLGNEVAQVPEASQGCYIQAMGSLQDHRH